MIKPIIRDMFFLNRKSEPATKEDLFIAEDLQDTLAAHRDSCVGMAANMIGYLKDIIIVSVGFVDVVMFNPRIIKKNNPYEAEEGCLSLVGIRKTIRYKNITVRYQDASFKEHTQDFPGGLHRSSNTR